MSALKSGVAVVLALLVAACGGHGGGTYLPGGVVAEGAAAPGSLAGGIYTSGAPHDPLCCWTQRTVRFAVRKDAAATDFYLRIYLPKLPVFERRPQGFVVLIDRRYRIERCCFGPGLHTVLFPLPPALREASGTFGVDLTMRTTFVPSREKFARDDRTLAVVLRSAGFMVF